MQQILGFLVVLQAFFLQPLELFQALGKELEQIGNTGKIAKDTTDFPFLTWLGIVGKIMILFVYLGIIFMGIAGFLAGIFGAFRNSIFSSYCAGGGIIAPILAFLTATALSWVMAISLELFLLLLNIADNSKKIALLLADQPKITAITPAVPQAVVQEIPRCHRCRKTVQTNDKYCIHCGEKL